MLAAKTNWNRNSSSNCSMMECCVSRFDRVACAPMVDKYTTLPGRAASIADRTAAATARASRKSGEGSKFGGTSTKTPAAPLNAAVSAAASLMSASTRSQPRVAQVSPLRVSRTTPRTGWPAAQKVACHLSANISSNSSNCKHSSLNRPGAVLSVKRILSLPAISRIKCCRPSGEWSRGREARCTLPVARYPPEAVRCLNLDDALARPLGPHLSVTRDNGLAVIVPAIFVNPRQLQADVRRAAKSLGADVVHINFEIGSDVMGFDSIFFNVVLTTKPAAPPDYVSWRNTSPSL